MVNSEEIITGTHVRLVIKCEWTWQKCKFAAPPAQGKIMCHTVNSFSPHSPILFSTGFMLSNCNGYVAIWLKFMNSWAATWNAVTLRREGAKWLMCVLYSIVVGHLLNVIFKTKISNQVQIKKKISTNKNAKNIWITITY